MPTNGNDDNNDNANKIIFIIKDTKLHVPLVALSVRDNQKLSKRLRGGFERPVHWNEYTRKSENKTRRYYLLKRVTDNYNVIINGKKFYDQAIDSDIKRYEEIRKLTTGQGGDYNTGCLLSYDYS